MSESEHPEMKKSADPPPIQAVRTEEPQAPFGQDEPNPEVVSDATADETAGATDPGLGGYKDRDPKTEMPRVPSAPDTQDDSHPHGGAPKTDKEPPASTDRV